LQCLQQYVVALHLAVVPSVVVAAGHVLYPSRLSNTSLQARSLRQRAVTNENDENAATTRLTRAKAANLGANESAADVPKKTLQAKKSTATLGANGAATRKRAALGDVSNVTKTDGLGAGAKDGKKPLAPKGNLARAAQPTKIEKPSRATTTRSILEKKDKTAGSSDLKKRQASGNGIAGQPAKKRTQTAKPVVKKEDPEEDEEEEEAENVEPQENIVEEADVKEVKQTNSTKKELAPIEEVFYDGPNLDAEDVDDPLMVSEYVVEIFEYLKELEIATMANPDYMDSQTELEWKMRGILVDWLLEVHTRFRLLPETLFLAVNIIDRFLSAKIVQLDRLQLVGVTAMFIASKYEEVLSPHVQNFRHVADDGFTEEEILSAERFVLAALNYDLSYPNPMNFLRRISKADNYDIQTRTLGKYLLEIGCLDHRFLAHPPSQVAAAAMYLARLVLERGPWVSSFTLRSVYVVLTSTGQHSYTLRRLLRGGDPACSAADDRLPLRPRCARGLLQEVCQQEVLEG
jgi:hypothetical protein